MRVTIVSLLDKLSRMHVESRWLRDDLHSSRQRSSHRGTNTFEILLLSCFASLRWLCCEFGMLRRIGRLENNDAMILS